MADAIGGYLPGSIPAQTPNTTAAEELPHENLGRDEALHLLESVFETQLESPAGIFDELDVQRFLAPDVAVISPPHPPSAEPPLGEERPGEVASAVLLDSTVPLRTESVSGQAEAVDLGLERSEGQIQPTNPLTEVDIPSQLGEGISLPGAGVTIELAGAPEDRATSVTDQNVAFLPNVGNDTDLVIAPTFSGVETLTHLRSPDAPRAQTFNLKMPAGAILKATEDGGATVVNGDKTLVDVSPPSAIDAAGERVPVSMVVEGNSLILETSPDSSTQFPVLVDPLYQTYEWMKMNYWQSGICNSSIVFESFSHCMSREEWSYEYGTPYTYGRFRLENRAWGDFSPVPLGTPGLFIETSGSLVPNERATMNYTVPRFFTDMEKFGVRPTSYISHLTLSNLDWNAHSSNWSPYMFAGIWDIANGWISYYTHEGLNGHGLGDMNWQYGFSNPGNSNGKVVGVSVNATEPTPAGYTELYVGNASIQLSDAIPPSAGPVTGPSKWVDQSSAPVTYTASDSGLGAHSLTAQPTAMPYGSQIPTWKTSHGCIGVPGSPCPRHWKSTDAGSPALKFEPSQMPHGIQFLRIAATDPVGNESPPAYAEVKVDHISPTLNLAGSLTEQASIGATAPAYTLKYSATDGDSAAPSADTPFGTAGTGEGKMQRPLAVALDSSGNFRVVDRECKCVQKYDATGKFVSQFGTAGTGNGQFADPRGIAIAPSGNILVSDLGNRNVQIFNSSGTFLRKVVSPEMSEPYGVTAAPGGTFWVADMGSGRVLKYNESTGALLASTKEASIEGGLVDPMYVAADFSSGRIWVTDYSRHKVFSFDGWGDLINEVGSKGVGDGQFNYPTGIALTSAGNLLIVDGYNQRLQELKVDGAYVRQFGSTGSAANQLFEPRGVAVGPGNVAYIADAGNKRIAKWRHAGYDPQSGVASAEVKLDGQIVDKVTPGCATKDCSLSREWTLIAENYSAGSHTVEVIATDAVGRKATRSFNITTYKKDTTPPQISVYGAFLTAPEGWVEQRSYPYMPVATDAGGHGVTSLVLKIDGVVVRNATQTCKAGGCSLIPGGTISTTVYSGGAHTGELIATDAAGNVAKKTWTVNVDPAGQISMGEAEDTLEAVDATSESALVAPTADVISPEERADGNNPSLTQVGGELESRGVPTPSAISDDPEDGFTIVLPETTVRAEPLTVDVSATDMGTSEDVAAVAGNISSEVDLVVRPIYSGLLTFASIRDKAAAESFSWEVELSPGQTLESVGGQAAEVRFASGHSAMLIVAEKAHDAVGTNVPTSLSVSEGNIVTLTVSHRSASYVYPIIGGAGWEGGYTTNLIVGPKDEQEVKEEQERIARERQEQLEREWAMEVSSEGAGTEWPDSEKYLPDNTGPSRPRLLRLSAGAPELIDAAQRKRRSKFEVSACSGLGCGTWWTGAWGTFFWNGTRGKVGGYAWRGDTFAKCGEDEDWWIDNTIKGAGWAGHNPAPYGHGKHLTFWCNFEIWYLNATGPEEERYQLSAHMYGSGYYGRHIYEYPPLVLEG